MASCSERAYASLSLPDAMKMLMFSTEAEATQYAEQVSMQCAGQCAGQAGSG